jgi:23S rRNA pseudouridine2605 synthase
MEGERIAKVMARAGLCSRREAEVWIENGRVAVNGELISSPALNVTPTDKIEVDGKALGAAETPRLWLFHKPEGVITSHKDPQGRKTVFSLLPPALGRVISVGRLDYNTEGLLLLTNSGAIAHHLENPQTGWIRRYRVRVYGHTNEKNLERAAQGLTVTDAKTGKEVAYGPVQIRMEKKGEGQNHWLVVSLKEGKNREIRNICSHFGLEVSRLIRVAYGPFQLGSLARGEVQEVPQKVLKEQLGKQVMGSL